MCPILQRDSVLPVQVQVSCRATKANRFDGLISVIKRVSNFFHNRFVVLIHQLLRHSVTSLQFSGAADGPTLPLNTAEEE